MEIKKFLSNTLKELGQFDPNVLHSGWSLVERVSIACNKPLSNLNIEDIRILLSQGIGLEYIVRIALIKLSENVLSEGDYYRGDLLCVITRIESDFWETNSELKKTLVQLITSNSLLILQEDLDKNFGDNFLPLLTNNS